jgi:putative ABC transport system permease protein
MSAQIERVNAEPLNVTTYAIDRSFPDVMGLQLAAGRSYPVDRVADSTSAVLVNEQTVARLGYATPAAAVGQTIRFENALHEVIGVVRDYHYDFMTSPIGPLVLYTGPARLSQTIVQARSGQMQAAGSQVEKIWSDLKPLHEAKVTPLAEKVYDNPMHRAMRDASSIVGVVSLLAILISSLGLFGTAVHMVERRRKEVGVRKALGATRRALVWLLTRRYVVLVAGTSLIALPIAWLVNRTWMQAFAYRVPVSPWVLGACALGLGTVALAIVATQTYRAAGTDPSVVLRTE